MVDTNEYRRQTVERDGTILAGGAVSAEINIMGVNPTALELPTAFDATTVRICFLVGMTSGALRLLREADETLVTVTVADTNTNLRSVLPPYLHVGGWNFIQLQASLADGTAVPQVAAKTINLICSKIV